MSWQHSVWPKDKHEEILELIRAAYGGDLPDWAIEADLVFHADAANHPRRPKPFPGRRVLEERYVLTEHKVKKHLRSPGWQEKCDQLGIPRPDRHLKGHGAGRNHPVDLPPVTPSASPSRTREPGHSTENHPVDLPPVTPSAATRAEIPPLLLSSSPPGEEQKDGGERRRAGEGKDKTPRKPKAERKTPNEAWARQLGDRWVAAWGEDRHGKYVWDWWKDRQHLTRAAAAAGVELNQPPPPEALDHLERAMAAYIGAARRGDRDCFPKGLPTVGGFVQQLSGWLMSTERTVVSADVPKATVEARVRRELDAGATLAEVRARLKVTTKLKPPEVAYALTFLDRLESR